jgi:predicted deacylase
MDVGYAPASGIVVYHLPKGAKVRKGAPVCEVIDPSDARGPKARTQVAAKTDGILFSRKVDGRLAWPGAVLFRIAGAKLLAHRAGLSGLDD